MKKNILEEESDALVADELTSESEAAWQKTDIVFPKKHGHLIADIIAPDDLMIFELSPDYTTLKVRWEGLASRLQDVFEEIIYSLPLIPSPDRNDDGCYTFSYSDDEYNLSVVSLVIKGKVALFFKNEEPSEN